MGCVMMPDQRGSSAIVGGDAVHPFSRGEDMKTLIGSHVAVAVAWALLCPSMSVAQTAQPAKPTQPATTTPDRIKAATGAIDAAAIQANTSTSKDWPTYGADYGETRYSKLSEITATNIKDLGLVWSYTLESTRGVEATPLVVDGVMYVTASWSVVHAIDVRTGKRLWSFDPKVPRAYGEKGCCDVVNRGVAIYKGRVYLGAFDGRLIALDAVSGEKVWEKDTRSE